ncbi:hypothetical protein As57867_002711, partial [Aphanomyces stellatus]
MSRSTPRPVPLLVVHSTVPRPSTPLLESPNSARRMQATYASLATDVAKPRVNPASTASFFSSLVFSWASPLLSLGNTRPLEKDDLWPVDVGIQCDGVSRTFEDVFAQTQSIPRTIVALFGWRLVGIWGMQLGTLVATLAGPVVLKLILTAMETETLTTQSGGRFDVAAVLQLVLTLFGLRTAAALLGTHSNMQNQLVAIKVTSALQHLLFQKAIRLNAASRREKTAGEIANMFSGDILTINQFALFSSQMVLVPVQILATLVMLYNVLDWVAVVALGVMVVNLGVNAAVSRSTAATVQGLMTRRDARMKSINEVFGAMQIIKLNAWEEKFADKIQANREAELTSLWQFGRLIATTILIMYIGPAVVITASFGTYTLVLHRVLTASKLFTALSLFSLLRIPMYQLPTILMRLAQALVSLKRFQDFFDLANQDPNLVATPATVEPAMRNQYADDNVIVAIDHATIGWGMTKPLFEDVNLTIKQGEFVVVHGAVGEGKSSLCTALLGEMDKFEGSIFVGGRVAYYSQQAWIQNMTIRENILFGKPYDRSKYNRVLEACALTKDLTLFAAGDRTEIGQKGVNLSGGQKARISLARACYSDAEIFILDSPLSAVDAIVQNEIFTKCFLGLLRHKTIVLVTHSPEIINSKYIDRLVEVKQGQLNERVVANQLHSVAPLVEPLGMDDGDGGLSHDPSGNTTTHSAIEWLASPSVAFSPLFTPMSPSSMHFFDDSTSGRLVQEEELSTGRVAGNVYHSYFHAVGGWPTLLTIIASCAFWQLLSVSSDLWLNVWSGTASTVTPGDFTSQSRYYLGVYAALAFSAAFSTWLLGSTTLKAGVAASRSLFRHMTTALLHAPMRFFDTNPIGRLLNRYSNDMTTVDSVLPLIWFNLIPLLGMVATGLGTAMVVIQWYSIAILPLLYIYVMIGNYYVQPAREIERVSKATKSPLLNLVAESIEGALVIRAFGAHHVERFLRMNARNIDTNNGALVAAQVLVQWYTLRVQLTTAVILLVAMTAMVSLHSFLSPGVVGLAFTYLLSNMSYVEVIINIWTNLETAMIGPERISQYTNIEPEAPRVLSGAVAKEWPTIGDIEFDNVSFRYKDNDPLVLKDVNVHIQSGEKIGIVGRTGAGKSSLTMALFRINELASGCIKIDGMDIAKVGVKTLRSAIAIIPQTPVLFKGTLRNYLDPFGEFSDDELWACLHKVKLADRIGGVDGKLDSQVEENGENFSVGERQMLCMARALLRQARIVVMDEATAAIDHETDQNLQRVIRTEFASSTVLTIAHRLDTVLDADRILVFDQGR